MNTKNKPIQTKIKANTAPLPRNIILIYFAILLPGLPGLPGSIRVETTVTDDHRQGKKDFKAYNLPSHIPQMMAKPRLALILIPLIFLSSSLVPSYALYFLITVLCMHAPQSMDYSLASVPASLGTCFSLSFSKEC